MAWIRTLGYDEAGAELRALYNEVRDPRTGALDHIMTVHSLHPHGLRGHHALYRAVMQSTPGLRRGDRELIAWVVSDANGCHY